MKEIPKFYNDLNEVEKEIFSLLNQGVKKRKSNFHNLALGTTSLKNFPDLRTVVLRGFSEKEMIISIHSDSRSKKIKHIEKNNSVSLLFYDDKKKIQLRIKGFAKLKKSYEHSWSKLTNWSKRCYLSEKSPGEISDQPTSGFSEKYSSVAPSDKDSQIGIENFCVIEISIKKIEWLYLASQGHRRAVFEIKKDDDVTSIKKKWLVP